jgi:hypothetical protein
MGKSVVFWMDGSYGFANRHRGAAFPGAGHPKFDGKGVG